MPSEKITPEPNVVYAPALILRPIPGPAATLPRGLLLGCPAVVPLRAVVAEPEFRAELRPRSRVRAMTAVFRATYQRLLLAGACPRLVRDWAEPPEPWTARARSTLARFVPLAAEAHARKVAQQRCGLGSPLPRLVCVGDRADPAGPSRGWTFWAKSGLHLLRALRALGYDELGDVYVLNQDVGPARLRRLRDTLVTGCSAVGMSPPAWLALGKVAERTLKAARVPALATVHPANHRRFRYRQGPDGYARLMLAAGVPAGPWAGQPLPALPCDPVAWRPALDVVLPARMTNPLRLTLRDSGDHASYPQHDVARRLFVAGGLRCRQVADLTGVPLARVRDWCRVEKWSNLRRRFDARSDWYRLEAEAEAQAKAHPTAWAALLVELRRLRDAARSLPASPETAERLAGLVYGVAILGDRERERPGAPRQRVEAVRLAELARQLVTDRDGKPKPLEPDKPTPL